MRSDVQYPLRGITAPVISPRGFTLRRLLFGTSNATGFTFEPWDMTTLYQDRAGTTPVAAVGQSVGYRTDKSGRGNHEVAINDAARGVYGREPKTGTRNRLTYTEQFDNAVWLKTSATVTVNSDVAPDGTTTADLITFAATGDDQNIAGYNTLTGTYAISVYIKANNAGQVGRTVRFDTTGAGAASTVVTLTDSWQRVTISNAPTGYFQFRLISSSGTTASSFLLWGAQLETGSTATAYQKVVSQYDVTEAGVASCYYVQTDGVDDAYVTPTITPGTDKAQVFMGLQKIGTGATAQIIAEMSVTRAANNGAFTVGVPGSVAGAGAFLVSRGTVDATAQVTTGYTPPTHVVLTGLADISGDVATLRANGSQIAQATTDQGTGNFLAYPAYLYASGGTTQPAAVRDYGHAARFGPNLDAATIARVEALIARNTPEVPL